MPRKSLLERIIDRRAGQSAVGTVSIATERWAEEFAREAMADEEFRRAFRETVGRYSEAWWKRLTETPRRRPTKSKRTRRRRATV